MPRRKNVTGKGSQQPATRRSTRQAVSRNKTEDDVPEVFQDMLIEAYNNNPEEFQPSSRPVKRRRVNNDNDDQPQVVHRPRSSVTSSPPSPVADVETPLSLPDPERAQQIVFNNDFSDEDDSDVSFEDVEISRAATPISDDEPGPAQAKTLQLDLSGASKALQSKQATRNKTKPLTKLERTHRLNVHKWHLSCLMLHLDIVNRWCNDETVHKTLKPLVSKKISNRLHLSESRTQAERKFSFEEAITEVCHIWKLNFKITEQGMRKAHWRDKIDMASEIENAPDPIDFEDFQDAAKRCRGSRDLGAQLFCALLRSLAVDTRLVFSLQVLPLARATTTTSTPQKVPTTYITAGAQDFGTSATASRVIKKKIVDSSFPIWWVEVFSPAITAWLPLDPLVRNTINKPRTGFEPPASDPLNTMSYVIGFEEDGHAKDITCRYTSYYNAKTRRNRVEITKDGSNWFTTVMQHFTKFSMDRHDRDVVEDADLRRRIAQEGMPKNVQDLKDHPVYVLERHLRHNEVIEPKRECGKFSVGSGKNSRLENVYRREHVHSCRSSEGWYRRGRDIQAGQQPLKRAVPRKKRAMSLKLDDGEGDEEDDSVPLYAEFQTEIYVPPPVVDGKVPRNGFGNLDVYVPSMIPAGGVHFRHGLAGQAAKILKIDAADAVTGFIFKGRQGTAVIDGVVIDERYTAVMLATITGLADQLEDDVNAQRSAIISSVWKKMHAVLKVRQRIQEDYGEKAGIDMASKTDDRSVDDDEDSAYEDDRDGGGFMPDVIGEATEESRAEEAENLKVLRDRAPIVLPAPIVRQRPTVVRSPHKLLQKTVPSISQNFSEDLFGDEDEIEADGFMPDAEQNNDNVEGGGFVVENDPGGPQRHTDSFSHTQRDRSGGGFMPDEDNAGGFVSAQDENQGGGFLPEDDAADGGGFLPSEELQQTHKTDLTNDRTLALPEITINDSSNALIASTQSTTTSTSNHRSRSAKRKKHIESPEMQTSVNQNGSNKVNKSNLVTDEDEDYDNNSLPSHDPEEDDLEMQWVEDAFED